ncbi:hypothetical protein FACS1894153_2220 [Bacteroidia bacterium]|nr:hypothetical protein FACS1894153_2220 [Bacteroidia bacterium]
MKQLLNTFFTYFDFSNSERKGIVALFCLFLTTSISTQVIPIFYKKQIINNSDFIDGITALDSRKNNHFLQKKLNNSYKKNDTNLSQNKGNNHQKDSNNYSAKINTNKKIFTVNANICDTLDLQEIYGIGNVLSNRIIKYREQLGGFIDKHQLLEVWGIDSAKYLQIEKHFIINTKEIRKIDINTISINDLKKHPYLDYYQAKAIVQEREKYGYFNDIEGIKKIELIDDKTFQKIQSYLKCE